MAGYSATHLPKKLGIAPPMTVLCIDVPKQYVGWLGELPKGVAIVSKSAPPLRAVHVFATQKAVLRKHLADLRHRQPER